jgi:hypothetical protein
MISLVAALLYIFLLVFGVIGLAALNMDRNEAVKCAQPLSSPR